jgi:flagellar export protein FliJ
MAKFKFRLQTVLEHRKRREDDLLAALAKSQRALQFEKDAKSGFESSLAQALARRESLGETATGIQAFITENDFIIGLKQRILRAEQGILRANRGVEKALRAYLFAKRQTRMIEMLREKALLEHKQLDEMMIMRHRLKEDLEGVDAGTAENAGAQAPVYGKKGIA